MRYNSSKSSNNDTKNIGDSKIFRDTSNKIVADFSPTPYRCGLCGDRFQRLTSLKEHHRTHQTQEEIDKLNQESKKTIRRRMPPKGRRRRTSNPNGKLHPCKQCQRVFNHSSSLSRHMRYHKGTMHTCAFCGRHFPQRCDLRRHLAMYHKAESEKINKLKQSNSLLTQDIILKGEGKNEELKFTDHSILFIKSESNYCEIHINEGNNYRKELLRGSLNSIEGSLKELSFFVRVHRSYIVNFNKIDKVSGTAQGYKIHFENMEHSIPVSRKQSAHFKSLVSSLR